MAKKEIDPLKLLSREELLQFPSGKISNSSLLDLAEYFSGQPENDDREIAVYEMILRSPLVEEMLDYEALFFELIQYYRYQENSQAAREWAVAFMAFVTQHQFPIHSILDSWREMGRVYLESGDLDTGLQLFARLLEREPGYVWTYVDLPLALRDVNATQLALEAAEQSLKLIAHEDPQDLRDQFEEEAEEDRAALDQEEDQTEQLPAQWVAGLREIWARPTPETVYEFDENERWAHLPPFSRLIDAPGDGAAEQEILAVGRGALPELILLGMDRELGKTSPAPLRAARLLQHMRDQGYSELNGLSPWLDRLPQEGEPMWLGTRIDKIGGRSIQELEAVLRDSASSLPLRDYALDELVYRVEQEESLRPAAVDVIRALINRPEADDEAEEETFTGYLISSAMDLKASELLPEIEQAFAEDRVDPQFISLEDVYNAFEIPRPEQILEPAQEYSLVLECAACGRKRRHQTKFVLLDQSGEAQGEADEGREMVVLDHEVICPKCGARDQYHVSGFDFVQFFELKPEQMAGLLLGDIPNTPPRYKPNVYMIRSSIMGQLMHVLDGVDEYRRQILRDPEDAEPHFRLGNIFRMIGRYEPSLESYRRAVRLDGVDSDILFAAATAEHDFGDWEAAKTLYQGCIEVERNTSRGILAGLSENELLAVQGLELLRKGKRSAWEYPVTNRQGKHLAPPARAGMEEGAKKDKRAHRHGKRR